MRSKSSGHVRSSSGALLREAGTRQSRGGTIGSLAKGLDVLDFVATSATPVRLRDVASRFGMDRSSAYRILATLEASGFLTKDVFKHYALGPKLGRLGRQRPGHGLLVSRLRPYLLQIGNETGMTTNLGVLERNAALLIEVIPARTVVSVRQAVGDLEPLHRGAIGKSLLANLPAPVQRAVLARAELQRFTENTTTDKAQLMRELDEIRQTGVAFDESESHEQVCCIASPILDDSGYPVAAMGIAMVRALVPDGARAQTAWTALVRDTAFRARSSLVSA